MSASVKRKDWLNEFVEKNLWAIIIVVAGLIANWTLTGSQVKANSNKIKSMEEAQIVIVENQKDIIELQVNQVNMAQDIGEIKLDVKTLLGRQSAALRASDSLLSESE